ncbi:MAG: phenylalanine--tRNA ligase subunit beta [Gemmatimonadetes bacterium]|nr:phenylalanine--tRNA ligase subunit beta [Gemmatimonadota bacterium]
MRVSCRWLAELLPGLDAEPAALAERLTLLGLLVDEMIRADRGLESVVLGRVAAVAAHPASDRLKVCHVDTGAGSARQIVCGAPIVREGAFYAVALPGARLPKGVELGVSEIRGVRSEGMLCSAPELGLEFLGDSGILEVDPDGGRPGDPIAPRLALDDTILVLDVPANRPDWESHVGVARELGWFIEEVPGSRPVDAGPRQPDADSEVTRCPVALSLLDREGCPYYSGVAIRDLRVGLSPLAVRQRLWLLGVRPINNVVDATNYVLLERGTPLHAFDLERLRGSEIRVRRAQPGETLVTLDGKERSLPADVTVIADRDRAVAIGGVMGGRETEVEQETTQVFLEAAFFDPARLRRSAARLGMRTEASHRFGRGVDPVAVPGGLARAVELLSAWAGGARADSPITAGAAIAPQRDLALRPERVRALAGLDLSPEEMAEALAGAGLDVAREPAHLRVRVPPHRYDLAREVDLVEEVARRIGYGRVPARPLPLQARAGDARRRSVADVARSLRALGLDQAYTPTFFDPAPFGPGFYEGRLIEQSNPLAQNERWLRPTLAATLILAVRHNLRRGAVGAAFFEIGHVFESALDARPDVSPQAGNGWREPGSLPALPGVNESVRVGIVLAGARRAAHWSEGGRPPAADLYDVKGRFEALLGDIEDVSWEGGDRAWLHPGQQAQVVLGGVPIGFAGRLHPRVERALDLPAATFVGEMTLEHLLSPKRARTFGGVSPYPHVERDLALVVPDAVPAARVLETVRRAGPADLEQATIFDVYRGEPVPAGFRSLALRLVFQSPARTLTEDDVELATRRLLGVLAESGIHLR